MPLITVRKNNMLSTVLVLVVLASSYLVENHHLVSGYVSSWLEIEESENARNRAQERRKRQIERRKKRAEEKGENFIKQDNDGSGVGSAADENEDDEKDEAEQSNEGNCDPNWENNKSDYETIYNEVWTDPSCYDFVLERRPCNGCDIQGPFNVKVRRRRVKNFSPYPDTIGYFSEIPTIDDLFEEVFVHCVGRCPRRGASTCVVKYGELGQIETFEYEYENRVIGDMKQYSVSEFQLCDKTEGDD